MDQNLLAKVKKILAAQLGMEEENMTETTRLTEDLEADSLDHVELIMAVEEEFGIDIDDGDAEKILTVGDLATYVEKHAD